jgi:uncharacterized protein YndB with AHSA1/START domain
MNVDVRTETVINRPIAVVSSYAADPMNGPKWYVNIRSVEWVTNDGLGVGAQVKFVAKFMGRELRYTYEIVEFEPGCRLVMRTAQGPFPMETTYTWTAVGETQTRMELRNQGSPSGFSRVAAPLMASAMQRANTNDLALLRTVLERT